MTAIRRALAACALAPLLAIAAPDDPLFDLHEIMTAPTDVALLDSETTNGIVFQTLEFTTRVVDGAPERITGIYAFPQGGRALPAVFWCQGGMAAANRAFPGIFAGNGYACLVITLPHAIRDSFRVPFNAADPKNANMSLLARDQLRGVTVLAQRPEVDTNRLAVAGASYGGVFATLLAGVDPRLKAGFSFFSGGHHELGSNLPQFGRMDTLADIAVWNRTFDPAFRLKKRDIPFMWGIAFNDHWFHFPAVAKTFLEAAGTGKRAVIMPHWQHGFPPHIDETLIRFLDTTPVAPRRIPPYNQPGPVRVRVEKGRVLAAFEWSGERPVEKAELIISYGEYTPWLGWPNRAAFVFPAAIAGQSAEAVLPIPSRRLPLIVWANLTDTNQFVVSTPPLVLEAADLAAFPITPNLVLNAFPDATLGDGVIEFYQRMGEPLRGTPEPAKDAGGAQALRVEPAAQTGRVPRPAFSVNLFHHVPGLAHRFSVRLRAEKPANLAVLLVPVRPANWRSPLVRQLVAQDPRTAAMLPLYENPPVPVASTTAVTATWREISLEVPLPLDPIDGYRLEITETPEHQTVFWLDSLRMQPVWPQE